MSKLGGRVQWKDQIIGGVSWSGPAIYRKTMSLVQPRKIYRGEAKTLTVNVMDIDCEPINLAGATVQLTVRSSVDDDAVLISKNTGTPAEAVITDEAGGIVEVHFLSADTQCREGTYIYDVQVIPSDTKPQIAVPPSPFIVADPVTRSWE
jgi:hypothetical protein